jgi:predicted phage tail protein
MNNKTIGIIVIILGALLAAVSLLADVLGLGSDLNAVGWKQFLGAGLGVLVMIVGVWFLGRKDSGKA